MRIPDHPARRPTRYHWAAGLNPLHWVPALGVWISILALGLTAALGLKETLPVVPWLAIGALGWSVLWLIVMPNSPRFKRATDARLAEVYAGDYTYNVAELIEKIKPDLHTRIQDITALRDKARSILVDKFGNSDPFAKDNLSKLDRLAISYLQLLAAVSEYGDYLALVDPQSIERDLDQARAGVDQTNPALAEVQNKQVLLLENRMQRYRKTQDRLALVRAECTNVETTMKLIVDQAMTAADSQRVGRDIDQVLSNIRESEVLKEELATFDDLERELDERRMREREG
jgi:hypothetical protein